MRGGGIKFWKPAVITQFYPEIAWHQNSCQIWEETVKYRNPSFLGSACLTEIGCDALFSFLFHTDFCSLHFVTNII